MNVLSNVLGRVEFEGDRFIIALPPEMVEDRDLREGAIVEFDVQRFDAC